jgi:regulatory protein
MPKRITGIELQKKNQQRVNVFLDGTFAFSLSRIVAAWLQVGQEISDEKIQQLQDEDRQEHNYQRALHYLAYKPRSTAELHKYLLHHQVDEIEAAAVLERLQKSGLLNDNSFAEAWIENQNEFRPRGRRALAYELRQRGIDDQTIQESLADLDEEALAYQAALKKSRTLKNSDWSEFQTKLSTFLARRGFDYDTVRSVVKQVWEEQRNSPPTGLPFEE